MFNLAFNLLNARNIKAAALAYGVLPPHLARAPPAAPRARRRRVLDRLVARRGVGTSVASRGSRPAAGCVGLSSGREGDAYSPVGLVSP